MEKRFSQAAENNKLFILEIIKQYIKSDDHILEIGSGTGQHISYFAESLPSNTWQPADLICNHESVRAWCMGQKNICEPIELNVNSFLNSTTQQNLNCNNKKYNIIYTANTCHIMSWPEVELMLKIISFLIEENGFFIVYGPFKFDGDFTSESNQQFDASLRAQSASMGIRDFEDIVKAASLNNLKILKKYDMPANNNILVFQKD